MTAFGACVLAGSVIAIVAVYLMERTVWRPGYGLLLGLWIVASLFVSSFIISEIFR